MTATVPDILTLTDLPVPAGVELHHLTPGIGTEVHGVDLRETPAGELADFLRALWLRRKVIFFRDQDISTEQHIAFGRLFGPLDRVPASAGNSKHGYPELISFRRGDTKMHRENFWHTDLAFSNPPVAGTVALLRTCPPIGGDTLFVNMGAAYAGLSPWLQRAADELEALQSFDTSIRWYNEDIEQAIVDGMMSEYPPKVMPVVQRHPVTGEKVLYVNQGYTHSLLGMPRHESNVLLDLFARQATVPEYQCRFRWAPNSLAFWDNRAVQHYATFDYLGQDRLLDRGTVLGQTPWPGVSQ